MTIQKYDWDLIRIHYTQGGRTAAELRGRRLSNWLRSMASRHRLSAAGHTATGGRRSATNFIPNLYIDRVRRRLKTSPARSP